MQGDLQFSSTHIVKRFVTEFKAKYQDLPAIRLRLRQISGILQVPDIRHPAQPYTQISPTHINTIMERQNSTEDFHSTVNVRT